MKKIIAKIRHNLTKRRLVKELSEKIKSPKELFESRRKFYNAYLVADRENKGELALKLKTIVNTIDWVSGDKPSPLDTDA
jgi:hypothetical protein